MYADFNYQPVDLKDIALDYRNPRIVTATLLGSQVDIVAYLFEHEGLANFIRKIAEEGKNIGAERPYIIKDGTKYIVIEGNTRIAAYQVLAGLISPPKKYASAVPHISDQAKQSLLKIDCSIAPSRDALLPIMANAHFGQGDKSKWGFLGSRKAVHDEWAAGRTVPDLAIAFDRTEGQIRELIIEFKLYQKALSFTWTQSEKERLQNPNIEFNPPVRFLQTSGHKAKLGIAYDTTNLELKFVDQRSERRYRHLINKLVVQPQRGLGATASWDQVFSDFADGASAGGANPAAAAKSNPSTSADKTPSSADPGASLSAGGASFSTGSSAHSTSNSSGFTGEQSSGTTSGASKAKKDTLFSYSVTLNSALLVQLMKEAREINCRKLPAAATFLLRNVIEALLKHIIDQQKANPASSMLDLEKSINLCMSNAILMPADDKKVLKEFQKNYVSYLNLGAHGTVIPNTDHLFGARDCIDQFVKKNI